MKWSIAQTITNYERGIGVVYTLSLPTFSTYPCEFKILIFILLFLCLFLFGRGTTRLYHGNIIVCISLMFQQGSGGILLDDLGGSGFLLILRRHIFGLFAV